MPKAWHYDMRLFYVSQDWIFKFLLHNHYYILSLQSCILQLLSNTEVFQEEQY